jgi:simple sugar transport system permease protein
MLTTLAAVLVGGTSVFGGKGTIFGTFIGVLIIGSLELGIIAIELSASASFLLTSVLFFVFLFQKPLIKGLTFGSYK